MAERELLIERDTAAVTENDLDELLARSAQAAPASVVRQSVVVGELLALLDAGRTPVIAVRSEDAASVRGRTTVDLHAEDVGQRVVIVFENDDPQRPIVIGVVRTERTAVPTELSGKVDLSADGRQMIVSAQRELVLRCGKASITLTQDGTVHIAGERILSKAKGANRVQGGSVQLN